MDHLGQGRLNFGVAASGLPSDWAMFNVDGMSGQNREMTREAWNLAVEGPMGRMMTEYFLPLLANFGFLEFLKHDPDVPDSDVTAEYCAKHNWLVGSPSTVAEKLEAVYDDVGGFGSLLVFGFDYADQPEAWHTSLGMLAKEVMPKVQHLKPAPATSAAE